jgi:hypothetical protein
MFLAFFIEYIRKVPKGARKEGRKEDCQVRISPEDGSQS